jgi:transcriptional regulator with XRE-family HTH domain
MHESRIKLHFLLIQHLFVFMNKLGRTIKRSIEVAGTSQKALADRCGVSPAYISNIVSGQAPGGRFLPTLVNAWDSDNESIAILIAYLYDEVVRAGRTIDEVEIRWRSKIDHKDTEAAALDKLAADLDLLEQLTGEQSMREKIHFMAELARKNFTQPNGHESVELKAAEDAAKYGTPVDGIADVALPPKPKKSRLSQSA